MWLFWLIIEIVIFSWVLMGIYSLFIKPVKALWRKIRYNEDIFPEDSIFAKWKKENPNGHINEYWKYRSTQD